MSSSLSRRARRSRSASALVFASLALGALFTGARAHAAAAPPGCTPPTLDQCQDATYPTTSCGQQQQDTCNLLITSAYQSSFPTTGDTKLEFLPDTKDHTRPPVSSNLRDGRWTMFDPSTLSVVASADPSYGGDQVRNLVTPATALNSAIGSFVQPFENDGNEVHSCREYVFKRYWDYTKFQRDAAACGRDSKCVYEAAMNGAFPITKPILYERNGSTPLDQQISLFKGHKAKNIFFDTPVTTYSTDAARRARYTEIASRQTANQNYYRIATGEKLILANHGGEIYADEWAFHRALHDKNVGVSDAQYQEYAERKAKLAALVDTRNSLVSCLSWNSFCSQANPFYTDQVKANEEAIFDMVSAEMDLGDDGCMSTANHGCDWSPDDFRKEMAYLFGKEMEAAYEDCTTLGGAARFTTANVPNATTVVSGVPYANPMADVPNYKAWSDARKKELVKEFSAVPMYTEADGTHRLGHVGSSLSANNTIGNPSWFSAGYSYDIGWDVRKALQKSAVDKQACAYAGGIHANFYVDATLLKNDVAGLLGLDHIASSETKVTEDALTHDGQANVSSHTTILGHDLYTPVKDLWVPSWTASIDEGSYETTHYSATVVIVAVPVTFTAYGQLDYGATASLTTNANIDCVNAPKFGLNLTMKPYAHVDAVGSVAIGVPGFEAGVKGQLALVHVDVPISGGVNVAENNPTERKPVLRFATRGDIELQELSGSLSIFAEAFLLTYEKEIFHWDGLHQPLNLWKTSADVELAAYALADAPTYADWLAGKK